MSCVASITPRLTKRQLRLASKQKLKYSSPAWNVTKLFRLIDMAQSPNYKIRERAALDYHVADVAAILLRDPVPSVRACLARNRELNWQIIAKLTLDTDEDVRAHAVLHPKTPRLVVHILSINDSSPLVRGVADWALAHHSWSE